jgi:hypothetical protein
MTMKTNHVSTFIVSLSLLLLTQAAQAFYHPSTGRWLSRDPLDEPGSTPWWVRSAKALITEEVPDPNADLLSAVGHDVDFNLYSLAENAPLQTIDGLGTSICKCVPGFPTFFARPPAGPGTPFPVGTKITTAPYPGTCASTLLKVGSKCLCWMPVTCVFQDTWVVLKITWPTPKPPAGWNGYMWWPKTKLLRGKCIP